MNFVENLKKNSCLEIGKYVKNIYAKIQVKKIFPYASYFRLKRQIYH